MRPGGAERYVRDIQSGVVGIDGKVRPRLRGDGPPSPVMRTATLTQSEKRQESDDDDDCADDVDDVVHKITLRVG